MYISICVAVLYINNGITLDNNRRNVTNVPRVQVHCH